MWTLFWDMHSGGRQKEKWAKIYIEASEDEAKVIFYNRFGHNPERVTCTCCGDDYSISSEKTLEELSGFHRGCRSLETPRYKSGKKKGLYKNDDPVIRKKLYYENGEKPPKGYKFSDRAIFEKYQTTNQYIKNKDVLVIKKREIKKEERIGSIPEQGYVWVG